MEALRPHGARSGGLAVPIPGLPGGGKNSCHAGPRPAHFPFEMTLCAWCDETIEAGPAAAAAPVSHGICPSCLDAKLAAVTAPRLRIARAAARPTRAPAFGRLAAASPASRVASSALA